MAQSPAKGKTSAYSQIQVRIPSVAIITLGNNQSKAVSYKSPSDLQKIVKLETTSTSKVLSNQKWSVNVSREQNVTEVSPLANTSKSTPSSQSSYTIVYVTTLN
jgi:hypothetical protein